MLIPKKMLLHAISIDFDITALPDMITQLGGEVLSIEQKLPIPNNIVVVRILSKKIINTDYNKQICLLKVSDSSNTYQVICGDLTCEVNDLCLLAKPGACVFTKNHLSTPQPLSVVHKYGHVSEGMLCSEIEIGIPGNPNVAKLPSNHQSLLGKNLYEIFKDDFIAIEATPNISRIMSSQGLAEELQAIILHSKRTINYSSWWNNILDLQITNRVDIQDDKKIKSPYIQIQQNFQETTCSPLIKAYAHSCNVDIQCADQHILASMTYLETGIYPLCISNAIYCYTKWSTDDQKPTQSNNITFRRSMHNGVSIESLKASANTLLTLGVVSHTQPPSIPTLYMPSRHHHTHDVKLLHKSTQVLDISPTFYLAHAKHLLSLISKANIFDGRIHNLKIPSYRTELIGPDEVLDLLNKMIGNDRFNKNTIPYVSTNSKQNHVLFKEYMAIISTMITHGYTEIFSPSIINTSIYPEVYKLIDTKHVHKLLFLEKNPSFLMRPSILSSMIPGFFNPTHTIHNTIGKQISKEANVFEIGSVFRLNPQGESNEKRVLGFITIHEDPIIALKIAKSTWKQLLTYMNHNLCIAQEDLSHQLWGPMELLYTKDTCWYLSNISNTIVANMGFVIPPHKQAKPVQDMYYFYIELDLNLLNSVSSCNLLKTSHSKDFNDQYSNCLIKATTDIEKHKLTKQVKVKLHDITISASKCTIYQQIQNFTASLDTLLRCPIAQETKLNIIEYPHLIDWFQVSINQVKYTFRMLYSFCTQNSKTQEYALLSKAITDHCEEFIKTNMQNDK